MRKPRVVSVEMVPCEKLRGADYNPRRQDPERLKLVELSLRKLGWLLPVYAAADGEILSGHQRVGVAQKLGWTEVPVVWLSDLDESRRKGVNIVFNRCTNDMDKTDSGQSLAEMLPMSIVEASASNLPDVSPDDLESYSPCLYLEEWPTRETMSQNLAPLLGHAIRQSESLWHWGPTSIPIVAKRDGAVVNGIGRLQHASEVGIPTVQTVVVADNKAELARILLNKLSMDFALDDRYADVLRYNSFRRASNRQKFLMPTMVCDLIMAMSKSGKTQRASSVFDPSNGKHVEAWKRWYGTTVLDFGAGLLDKSLIMRDTMGVDCVAFEPYYTGGKDSGFDLEAARYITEMFLIRVADGTQFDSIFLASVLNSVPFKADREAIVRIVSALCGPKTTVYAGAISKTSDRFQAATGIKKNISNHETQFDSAFAAGYEDGVVVSDLMKRPKAQKYFSADEWRDVWNVGFSDVRSYEYRINRLVQAICKSPLPVDQEKLGQAIRFEFDLPFPDGDTLGMADLAVDAFSRRLSIKL